MSEQPDPLITEAIIEAARAGVFRRAARLNPSAVVWSELADEHSARTSRVLAQFLSRIESDKP